MSELSDVGAQNVNNPNSEIGTQNNICGNNNTISVSSTRVKTNGLEVQVSEPVSSFHGREDVLREVHEALQEPRGGKKRRLVVLCGLGGIGKTECARAYIQRFRKTFTNTIWLNCENEQDIKSSLLSVYSQMNLAASSTPHDVYKNLNSNETLFVFDNAQNMNSISPYLPRQESKCLFLVTSQRKDWSPHVSVELGKLDVKAAMDVLGAVLEEHDTIMDTARLAQLAERLDRIPLVLQISAGFICQQVLDFRTMEEEYNIDEIVSELETKYDIITTNFPEFFDCNGYLKSVYAALMRTMEKMWSQKDHHSRLAADALGVAAFLHPDQLDLKDFKAVLNIEDDRLFMRAWAILLNYSLVQKRSCWYFTIHRSIQQCLQLYYNNNNEPKHYKNALKLLLQDNFLDNYHFPILYEHGVRYYETLRQFYSQNTTYATVQALVLCSNNELLALLVKELHLIHKFRFLCLAALLRWERSNIIQILFDNGADFNSADEIGNVLHHLCYFSKYHFNDLFYACCVFVKHGANPKTLNAKDQTAIDMARHLGCTELAELLECMNPNINNFAQLAIKHSFSEFVRHLFDHDLSNINQQDEMGNTVIHALCSTNPNLESFYFLSRRMKMESADLRITNAAGETAADVAKCNGRLDLAELLQPGAEGPRDLYVAAKYADLKAISHLCRLPVEYWSYRDELDRTPLHMLCALSKTVYPDQDIINAIRGTSLVDYLNMNSENFTSSYDTAQRCGREILAKWITDPDHDDFMMDCETEMI